MSDQFTRRAVNRALLTGALAFVAADKAAARPRGATPLLDFAIAGGGYHGLERVRDEIEPGERLTLRAEPGNSHDANAVAVHRRDGLMLGYIPREANAPIAALLQRGAEIDAVVVEALRFRRDADIPTISRSPASRRATRASG